MPTVPLWIFLLNVIVFTKRIRISIPIFLDAGGLILAPPPSPYHMSSLTLYRDGSFNPLYPELYMGQKVVLLP